jgi:hypothetical protein
MDIKKLKEVAEKASPNLSVDVSWINDPYGPDKVVVKSEINYPTDEFIGEVFTIPVSKQAKADAEFINTFNPTTVKSLLSSQIQHVPINPLKIDNSPNKIRNILQELIHLKQNSELNTSQEKLLQFIYNHIEKKYAN